MRSTFIGGWVRGCWSPSTRKCCFTNSANAACGLRKNALPVIWDEVKLEVGFRADLIVENLLIVELKSQEAVAPVHKKILLTYLRLADMRLGLLINFGTELLKEGISRVVNGLAE